MLAAVADKHGGFAASRDDGKRHPYVDGGSGQDSSHEAVGWEGFGPRGGGRETGRMGVPPLLDIAVSNPAGECKFGARLVFC